MSLGKREIILLSILGLVIYAFVFYQFIWVSTVPQVNEVNNKILMATREMEALDKDIANIENIKAGIEINKANSERLKEYLMDGANAADSLEYVDKLFNLLPESIIGANISAPKEITTESGNKYYEIGIDLKAKMKYAQAIDFINFLEGGTRKISVTKFNMDPLKEEKNKQGQQPIEGAQDPKVQEFNLDMTVNLYALTTGSTDKLYEYARHKFNRFINNNGILFVPSTGSEGENGNSILNNNGNNGADIAIKEKSFLVAGENLEIFGVDKLNDILRVKTRESKDVEVKFTGTSYEVSTTGSSGNPLSMGGALQKDDISIRVDMDIPLIKENNNIALNIKIVNDTDRKVKVTLNDNQKRVKIYDRDGKQIYGSSSKEKLTVI